MTTSWDEPLETLDASGVEVTLSAPARRVISLVPSITESIFALGAEASLIGRTRYCIHPAPAVRAIEALGGTKDPNLARIIELAPDLILANREENIAEHVTILRDAGLTVHVSEPRTPDDALILVAYLGTALDRIEAAAQIVLDGEMALAELEELRSEARERDALRMTPRGVPKVLALIWREPWMAAGGDTYISSMIESLGGVNLMAAHDRYPEIEIDQIRAMAPDILLLPNEPYKFGPSDQAELASLLAATPAAKQGRIVLCEGEDLMWFGARTPSALRRLRPLFA